MQISRGVYTYLVTFIKKKSRSVYCPAWMYDIASARVAFEFLHSEMPLESFAAKYSQGFSESYSDVPEESLLGAAQGMLEFLAEIEAGENAALMCQISRTTVFIFLNAKEDEADVWLYRRCAKAKEYSDNWPSKPSERTFLGCAQTLKMRFYGWKLEDDEHIVAFGDLVRKQVSILDAL